ncbi:hypothetical protein [Streptomyces litchfieldiae]|uniref:YokE-like PH domain-containing protein n=1 Tax=Streptomyces litchfieldiae TaxID=3075543 RepID=A0ABU2MPA9_9ACTN|nr:hypothetical protein [Streptomyces sp. DSM 44938]MDT0343227.1 hypothetical protein [Streptomyces sp. DSM 44938]
MPFRKEDIQAAAWRMIAQANPTDRPLVTFVATTGRTGWLGEVGGLLSGVVATLTLFSRRMYTITLTEQAVVFIKTGQFTTDLKYIKWAIPRAQAAASVGEVRIDPLRDRWIAFTLPGKRKPNRLTADRQFDGEMRYFVSMLTNPSQMGR